MRMIDENGSEIFEYDPQKGHLTNGKLFLMHHEAVEAVEEKGHWEVISEYPNGGKDVQWVVDAPATKAADAWDEYEDVLQFVPFTAAELASQKISELKQRLAETDYHILKIVEGAATLKDCAEIIRQRASWRAEINRLESEVNE